MVLCNFLQHYDYLMSMHHHTIVYDGAFLIVCFHLISVYLEKNILAAVRRTWQGRPLHTCEHKLRNVGLM